MSSQTLTPGGVRLASLGTRVGAHVIDSLLASLVISLPLMVTVFGVVNHSVGLVTVGMVLYPVAAFGYAIWMMATTGSKGWTVGKKVCGLRVVDAGNLAPIGFWRACGRQLLLGLIGPLNLIQLFTIPKRPMRQGWHDSAVRTMVVYADGLDAARATGAAGTQIAVPVAPPLPSLMGPAVAAAPAGWPAPAGPPAPLGWSTPAAPAPPAPLPPAPVAAPVSEAPAIGQITPPPGIIGPPPGMEPSAPAPAAVPATPAPPVAPPVSPASEYEVDERTVARARVVAGWALRPGVGEARELQGTLLVGRDPKPGLVEGAGIWAVDDPKLSVSKTHAVLRLVEGQPEVEDWGSTNGTHLVRGSSVETLAPHQPTRLRVGDRLELGDFVVHVEERP